MSKQASQMTLESQIEQELILAEGNFEELPYFRVGDRNARSGIMRYENEVRTREGHVLRQVWTVMAAHGKGLPGRFDQDVYFALLQLIDRKGLPQDRWLRFSLYELVEIMGKGHSGRDYRRIKEALQRLATTTIESENAFYQRGTKDYYNGTFSLLSEVRFAEHADEGGKFDRNWVLLSSHFVDSYKANYLKHLDAAFYWSLSSPIAKRLYRLIDKKRNGRSAWEMELFSLRDKIPLSNYKYASKIKEKLKPAHTELVSKQFLDSVEYRSSGEGEFACYRISSAFSSRKSKVRSLDQFNSDEYYAFERLRSEGIDMDGARHLVSQFGPVRCLHYADSVKYQKNLRKPAAWLRAAIQNGYELDLPPVSMHNTTQSQPRPSSPDSPGSGRALSRPDPDPEAQRLWETLIAELPARTDSRSVEQWFEGSVATSLSDSELRVCCANDLQASYIEEKFSEHLRYLLSLRLSPEVSIYLYTSSSS
jgi:hypothetical protein